MPDRFSAKKTAKGSARAERLPKGAAHDGDHLAKIGVWQCCADHSELRGSCPTQGLALQEAQGGSILSVGQVKDILQNNEISSFEHEKRRFKRMTCFAAQY